jgi:GTPase
MSYFHHMNGIQIGYLSPTHISAIKKSVSVSTIEHNMLEIFKINVKNLTRV